MTHKIYVATTVGATRYLQEWFNGISLLSPSSIAIAVDEDRSEPLPPNTPAKTIRYKSGRPWKDYEHRHDDGASDYSIGLGILLLLQDFLKTDNTHFIHIDSDVILTRDAARHILSMDWDTMSIVTAVIPRDRAHDPRAKPMRFWDSTNFGVSRSIAETLASRLPSILENPHPIDIRIHDVFREIRPQRHKDVLTGVYHYIRGRKVLVDHAL